MADNYDAGQIQEIIDGWKGNNTFEGLGLDPNWIAEIQFEGFDVKKIIWKFDQAQQVLNNKQEDLAYLLMTFHERGNSISKIIRSSAKSANLVRLKNSYGIVDKVKRGGNASSALTLSRISQAFCWLACDYSNRREARVPVTMDRYHKAMYSTSFGGMIPDNHKSTEVLTDIFAAYQVKYSELIGNNDVDENRVKQYIRLSIKGSVLNNQEKVAYLRRWGILNREEDYLEPAQNC
ncbi:uncharacterized protein LOC124164177 [Ischnura elegans]|uniref:uncharacterized protein LOC124164177 n=1 Tax=Ischnura elegans TaxID=197161 RepID=UPI001ED8B509|nr:uncharacterized protein LOC124164177 [Ischnura elegans]